MRISARLAVVPLAAALLLTGCGRPGTAATVDGDRISDASVTNLVEDLNKLNGTTTTPQTALTSLVVGPTVLEVASSFGGGASTEQAVALLDDVAERTGLAPWDYSDEAIGLARVSLASEAISTDLDAGAAVNAAVEALTVEVNPRFGSWQSPNGVTTTDWPWLITSDAGSAG